tara:strand:+ start:996 stop:1259 length:264 start_codon:yes stop_codon:yes gene_type:complete
LENCSPEIMNDSSANSAVFYNISVTSSEGGTVSTFGGSYKAGSTITISAKPDQEYIFSEWMGIESSENPLNLNISSDFNISAIFIKQ